MKVTKINDTLYCITPEEGLHLTQATLQEDEQRNFCCSAYELSEEDTEKWIEWSEEQRAEYISQVDVDNNDNDKNLV